MVKTTKVYLRLGLTTFYTEISNETIFLIIIIHIIVYYQYFYVLISISSNLFVYIIYL